LSRPEGKRDRVCDNSKKLEVYELIVDKKSTSGYIQVNMIEKKASQLLRKDQECMCRKKDLHISF
jgi:hypothetical protein